MPISDYHKNQVNRSEEETNRRASVKEMELLKIFSETGYKPGFNPVRVAVLGCADKRFIKLHKEIFEKLLGKPVQLLTFDITVDHLAGEENVIKHDVRLPIPGGPYDITFAHVLLKFINTGKQFDVILNSYKTLRSPGLGVFVFDLEDIATAGPIQKDGRFSVPIEAYKRKLEERNIKFKDIRWKIDLEKIPIPIRGLEGGALIIEK